MKKVFITAFPNIKPAGTVVVASGEGSSLKVAIKRACENALNSPKLHGKRIVLPMKLVVTEGDE